MSFSLCDIFVAINGSPPSSNVGFFLFNSIQFLIQFFRMILITNALA